MTARQQVFKHAGTDEPGDEVLWVSERTRVVRRHLTPAHSVILKRSTGPESLRRLRHEELTLKRLGQVDGVLKLAPKPPGADDNTLFLVDDKGVSLAQVLAQEKLDIPAVLRIAVPLARTLAAVHRGGVIHKDLNPANILLVGEERRPVLIDFNIASSVAQETPGFTHQSEIAGTLAYMAPEQTGRMGRTIDLRADLYAFGVALYEMVVGRKPFDSSDLLDLVHDHLVRIPTAPTDQVPGVPRMLSDLIMRLLEKEPDRRYQSAEGLAHDLARIAEAMRLHDETPFELGQSDFPQRLLPPSRLIGRDTEMQTLQDAIAGAIEGRCPCLLVAGAPGVGKTALLNTLRPMVTARRGWFASGKFDQYRQDAPTAALDAMRVLGRLLLAEPEDRLAEHRERIKRSLGSNIGFGPARLTEFRLLLGQHPRVKVADPREAEARLTQATLDLLGAIASPERPVVMVLDDMQWAPPVSLSFLDAMVTAARRVPGLLVVAAYRSNEVDAAHPLNALKTRWNQLGLTPPQVELNNLPANDMGELIREMLRLPPDEASRLALALSQRTDGNPYDTVELVNALRHDGLLVPHDGLWTWDAAAIRRHVGNATVIDLLGRRIARLPEASRGLLETMACLRGEMSLPTLELACASSAEALHDAMAPALEDGLLAIERGAETTLLRFRHDRVQEAVFEAMDEAQRVRLHLVLARRLAASGNEKLASTAAEQYLPAAQEVTDEAERRRVIELFRHAAVRSRVLNYGVAESFLQAAIKLLRAIETPADAALVNRLLADRHVALYGLGRLSEANAAYDSIVQRCADPMDRVASTVVQMYSLVNQGRDMDSVHLGLGLLAELGLPMPQDRAAAIGEGFKALTRWSTSAAKHADHTRPLVTDKRVLAWADLISTSAHAAYFCDLDAFAWLTLESLRLWDEHGPCASLLRGASLVSFLLAGLHHDYRGAYLDGRHFVEVGEARGLERGTAIARCLYGISAGHWGEPIENVVESFTQAREDLTRTGENLFASYTYITGDLLLDCAPTLDAAVAEVNAGLAFAARTGNLNYQRYLPRRQLIKALRGETQAPGSLSDAGFDEAAYTRQLSGSGLVYYHITRTILAALFNDKPALAEHAAASMKLLAQRMSGHYVATFVYTLQGIALAERARGLPPAERAPLIEELDERCLAWITRRAEDVPVNFLHLQRWLEAERAWACESLWAAGEAFDAALREAALHQRPWHRALITERAADFHLHHGLEESGRALMEQACSLYESWGASGKVREMRRQHAFLRSGLGLRQESGSTVRSGVMQNDMVDMLAVLRASQALSSETSLALLTDRVAKVLGSMTGATAVQLVVRPDPDKPWCTASSLCQPGEPAAIEEADAAHALPLSVFRYVERTREALVLEDATRDDRFAGDPYIAGRDQCAMLIAPIINHGQLRAMLLLENNQSRGAFSGDRLDAVMLIAGQLAVSLDNALLYASLERKVAERTEALAQANQRLEMMVITDPLTGLANRRRFNEVFDTEWRRALRQGTYLGLVMIDIDQFKLYNDHYGHLGGDECLKKVAACLQGGLRPSADLVARYGGEEFVLVLPATDLAGAYSAAERLRCAVAGMREPHAPSTHGIVTISMGVTSFVPSENLTAAGMMEVADAALYEAKRRGRNQVWGHLAGGADGTG